MTGMLEVVGLTSLSSSLGASFSSPSRRAFGRSTSFGGAGSKGMGAQEVRIAEGVRVDEVLRGLGVDVEEGSKDVREEEVCAIWMREKARLDRDIKTLEAKFKGKVRVDAETFVDAMED